ncbi:transmembrane protein [Tieghemostelium lacteum]|uniref:Phospholipid-transporting ATPase n=1 Tax=Tieghemostelium lacteum TaxID=361077 RepID=A0A152A4C0_TIELA|nr:transmembrane protein [Tieghemostelium lacteum]|eukprot:KYR01098.1 transmembrane protein [Tieghemostelium lacteum]
MRITNLVKKRKKRFHDSYPLIHVNPSSIENPNHQHLFHKSFCKNEITTTKYTRYNFIFKNLFEQFKRLTNIYFLVICIITFIPEVSPFDQTTTIIPLVFVLTITAIKEGYEDYQRYKADNKSNKREFLIYSAEKKEFEKKQSKHIKVGDLIKVENNQPFPSDLVFLKSSLEDGLCYVETSQLDGESNLKIYRASSKTYGMTDEEIINLNAGIQCEIPNHNLYRFHGSIQVEGEDLSPLDEKNLLLRGAALRNTGYILGVVIYCGKDTKLSLNQKNPPSKFSSVEKKISKSVIGIFAFKMCLVVVSTILGALFQKNTASNSWYLWNPIDPDIDSLAISIVKTFFTYFALLSFLVPMSLMVTLEVVKVSQSKFMQWDLNMSYKEKFNVPIDYETQSPKDKEVEMVDLKQSITPNSGEGSSSKNPVKEEEQPKKYKGPKYMSVNNSNLNDELAQVNYVFSDKTGTLTENRMVFSKCSIKGQVFNRAMEGELNEFIQKVEDSQHVKDFLMVMGLCHMVISETNQETNVIKYQSQSPDEISLCDCARENQYTFLNRTTSGHMELRVNGELRRYQLLSTMDFNSERRRMSVLVRDLETLKIFLFSKGADSVMIDRLCDKDRVSDILEKTKQDIMEFATEGLRILILGMKEVDEEEFQHWYEELRVAQVQINDRHQELERVHDIMERDLHLVGCTAIEDKLQDGVPETIEYLINSNIKVWIITGDKQETAINIGHSCRLLSQGAPLMILNAHDMVGCRESLEQLKQMYKQIEADQVSMVVDGVTLTYIFMGLQNEFLELATKCHSVICCKATPLQKALVVNLVKKSTGKTCLAIGDGANDVSMIQEAQIGVGVYGNEGTQASRASDYAILRFRHLSRLLAVHGRYSILRNTQCIQYSFYKNMTFFFVEFLYSFHNGFSAQTLYSQWLITVFNTVVTATQPYLMALFEKDVHESVIEKNPHLYKEVQEGYFTYWTICKSLMGSLFQSILMYFGLYLLFREIDLLGSDGIVGGKLIMGSIAGAYGILAIQFFAAIETKTWNIITHIFYWASMVVYVLVALVECSFPTLPNYYVYQSNLQTFQFYLMVVLMIVMVLVPHYSLKFLRRQLFPIESEILQEQYLQRQLEARKLTESSSRMV